MAKKKVEGEEQKVEEEKATSMSEEAELDLESVITERDSKKDFPTHKKVLVTEKVMEKNPGLADNGVKVGDVIQVKEKK